MYRKLLFNSTKILLNNPCVYRFFFFIKDYTYFFSSTQSRIKAKNFKITLILFYCMDGKSRILFYAIEK